MLTIYRSHVERLWSQSGVLVIAKNTICRCIDIPHAGESRARSVDKVDTCGGRMGWAVCRSFSPNPSHAPGNVNHLKSFKEREDEKPLTWEVPASTVETST